MPATRATAPAQDADAADVEAFQQYVAADLAAAMSAPLTWMGDKLGLWRAMADGEPVSPSALAARTGTNERMTREWLCAQAAAGYVCVDPHGTFHLPAAHAAVLAGDGPGDLQGGFDCVTGAFRSVDRALEAMRDGRGLGWDDHHEDFHRAVERLFRPTYDTHLVNTWLPALGTPIEKLAYGGSIVDIGCGRGGAAVLLAKAFPLATVRGFDDHGPSIDAARALADASGVAERCTFDVVAADAVPCGDHDLVILLDCLHDMADPFGAARRAREIVSEDGVVMVVEPIAGDSLEDNLHPIGRLLYSASTLACIPNSLDGGGPGLGAQAGPAATTELLRRAGFGHVRTATTTGLNFVLDARR